MSQDYVIYTDGSVYPEMPGYGGWAAIIRNIKDHSKVVIKGATKQPSATNQRMELVAALKGLQAIETPAAIMIITDCKNLYMAFVENHFSLWEQRDWRRKKGTEIQDKDVWLALRTQAGIHDITWRWIRSHGVSSWNKEANDIAYRQARHAWYTARGEEEMDA